MAESLTLEELATVRDGDEAAFAALAERYRRQLQVHRYRMLGSLDDAEDLVQETFLRASTSRSTFEGRSQFRTWLYRIATNACLRALELAPRCVIVQDVAEPVTIASDWSSPPSEPEWAPELPWLQPYPDHLLDATSDAPEAVAVSRETIELAYLAALQHLPPRQRAALILRDALDWSAKDAADTLDMSVQSVNSALQRARATLRTRLTQRSHDWAPTVTPTAAEREVLERFVDAWERADANAIVALVREDVRWAMPPAPLWFDGRAAVAKLFGAFPIGWQGELRVVPSASNRQPAALSYLRAPGASAFRLASMDILRIEGGQIVEMTRFYPGLLRRAGLSEALAETD